jgi:hypothetical protein
MTARGPRLRLSAVNVYLGEIQNYVMTNYYLRDKMSMESIRNASRQLHNCHRLWLHRLCVNDNHF